MDGNEEGREGLSPASFSCKGIAWVRNLSNQQHHIGGVCDAFRGVYNAYRGSVMHRLGGELVQSTAAVVAQRAIDSDIEDAFFDYPQR